MKRGLLLCVLAAAACRSTLSDEQLLRLAERSTQEGQTSKQDARGAKASGADEAQVPTHLDDQGATRHAAALRDRFDAARLLQLTADLEVLRRESGNADFDRALDMVLERLRAAGYGAQDGLELVVRETRRERPAWNALGGKLELLHGGKAETLAEFDSSDDRDRLLLPAGAPAAQVEGPLATRLEDVVPGSVLVGAEAHTRERLEAARAKGAVLVVAADLADYNRDPSGKDRHEDAVGYRSVPADCPLPAAQVSPRMLARLVQAAGHGGRVRFEARVAFEERPLRTVVATVVGDRAAGEEVVVAAHVQEPGACDNASGVSALCGMAEALAALARDGARPSRSVTFVCGDEMEQSRVHLETTTRRVVAAIAADMLGESRERTGAIALLERAPDPGAVKPLPPDAHTAWGGAPVDESRLAGSGLAVVVRQAFHAVAAKEAGWRFGEHPFEGGSDHVVFLRRGVPSALVWHFPDWTYHTSLDRLEMVDAEELRRSATTVLVAALTVADARPRDLDGLLRALRAETQLRVARAAEAGDEPLAALWRAHEDAAREELRRWCLGMDTPSAPRKAANAKKDP